MPISPGAAISLQPPTTKTRCVPVLTPASANSTVTSMRIDHPRCPGTAGIYATIVTDPTIRNGSNRYLPPEVDMAVSARAASSRGVDGILERPALAVCAPPGAAGGAYSLASCHLR